MRFELTTCGLRRHAEDAQSEALRDVAPSEGAGEPDRDPACFTVCQDDSSRNVTEKREVYTSASDAVEAALAEAIRGATSAGRWDVVAQLASELEARRLARAGNVVVLGEERAKRIR